MELREAVGKQIINIRKKSVKSRQDDDTYDRIDITLDDHSVLTIFGTGVPYTLDSVLSEDL